MKLKAQIEAMKVEASRKRREAYKADDTEMGLYYEGIEMALSWVQESRDKADAWPLYTYEKSPL